MYTPLTFDLTQTNRNVNSAYIMTKSKPYHHGDLKRVLSKEARKQIDAHGIEKLSIRACARNVGVHATAAYRHFKTKDEMIAYVVSEGFTELSDIMSNEVSQAKGARDRLLASGATYISFAIDNPHLFRAMFSALNEPNIAVTPRPKDGKDAYEIFNACYLDIREIRAIETASDEIDRSILWSSIHGYAELCISGLNSTALHDIYKFCHQLIARTVPAKSKTGTSKLVLKHSDPI